MNKPSTKLDTEARLLEALKPFAHWIDVVDQRTDVFFPDEGWIGATNDEGEHVATITGLQFRRASSILKAVQEARHAAEAEPVKVKALEWVEPAGCCAAKAETSIGLYSIEDQGENWSFDRYWLRGPLGLIDKFDDIETPKAAAQAHYEQRIRSALVAPGHLCPICAEPLKVDDMCAVDIELGICHAACLEGSPTVNLDTGEPVDGSIPTFRYEEGR